MKLYRFLTGPDDASFCKRVSAALNKGWELYGDPTLTTTNGQTVAGQALIKETPGEYTDNIDLTRA